MGAPSIKQPLIATRARYRFVSFEIAAVSITASSTLTHSVSLTDDDYKRAIVQAHNKDTITDTRRQRLSATLFVTRDSDESASNVGHDTGSDRYMQGFDRASGDTVLSFSDFSDNNGAVRINSAKINGSNLEIEFEETAGASQTIDMYGVIYAFRDHN